MNDVETEKQIQKHKYEMVELADRLLMHAVELEDQKRSLIRMAIELMEPLHGEDTVRVVRYCLNYKSGRRRYGNLRWLHTRN
jgi:hypothetical protein